jgi:hypothetical protein
MLKDVCRTTNAVQIFLFSGFRNLVCRQSVGLLGQRTGPQQGRYLHRTTQTQNIGGLATTPRVEFEPTIPVNEQTTVFGVFPFRSSLFLLCISFSILYVPQLSFFVSVNFSSYTQIYSRLSFPLPFLFRTFSLKFFH